jgi:hypothetical protein
VPETNTSLLGPFVSYRENKMLTQGPGDVVKGDNAKHWQSVEGPGLNLVDYLCKLGNLKCLLAPLKRYYNL